MRADAVLSITGRDVEEKEVALKFDQATFTWHLLGNAEDFERSKERQEVLDLLRDADEPLTPKKIAKHLGRNHGATKKLLFTMYKSGEVKKKRYGEYISGNSGNFGNSENMVTPVKAGKSHRVTQGVTGMKRNKTLKFKVKDESVTRVTKGKKFRSSSGKQSRKKLELVR